MHKKGRNDRTRSFKIELQEELDYYLKIAHLGKQAFKTFCELNFMLKLNSIIFTLGMSKFYSPDQHRDN